MTHHESVSGLWGRFGGSKRLPLSNIAPKAAGSCCVSSCPAAAIVAGIAGLGRLIVLHHAWASEAYQALHARCPTRGCKGSASRPVLAAGSHDQGSRWLAPVGFRHHQEPTAQEPQKDPQGCHQEGARPFVASTKSSAGGAGQPRQPNVTRRVVAGPREGAAEPSQPT